MVQIHNNQINSHTCTNAHEYLKILTAIYFEWKNYQCLFYTFAYFTVFKMDAYSFNNQKSFNKKPSFYSNTEKRIHFNRYIFVSLFNGQKLDYYSQSNGYKSSINGSVRGLSQLGPSGSWPGGAWYQTLMCICISEYASMHCVSLLFCLFS